MPSRRILAGGLILLAAIAVIFAARNGHIAQTKNIGKAGVQAAPASQFARASTDFDDVVHHLKENERKLINLRLMADSVEEKLAPDGTTWSRTPVEVQEDVYLNGSPGEKGRIDCHKMVCQWIGGPSPYSYNEPYSIAFNGRDGTTLYPGRRQGEISPGRPPGFDVGRGSMAGTGLSIYYWNDDAQQGLGEYLEAEDRRKPSGAKTTVTPEMHDGVQAIRIEFSTPRYSEKFWLDPARGYSILDYVRTNTRPDGTTRTVFHDQVTKLVEAAHGVWIPAEAFREYERNGTVTRIAYTGSNIVANDKNFDQSIFTIAFPAGITVDDKTSAVMRTRSAISRTITRGGRTPGRVAIGLVAAIFVVFVIAIMSNLRKKKGRARLLG